MCEFDLDAKIRPYCILCFPAPIEQGKEPEVCAKCMEEYYTMHF